jgi:hypothetical protein
MEPFFQEQTRVEIALLEMERQRVKLLISTGNTIGLTEYALSAISDLEIITAEIRRFRIQREKRNAFTPT